MILDKDLFNQKIEGKILLLNIFYLLDKKLRPSASGLMKKLNENFPIINNDKFPYKKDFETNSNISDKINEKKNLKRNESSKYSRNDNESLFDDNIIRFKKNYNKNETKFSSKNRPVKDIKKKETLNVSSSSDTLGSDFNKINENNKKNLKVNKQDPKNYDIPDNDKKENELNGIKFNFLLFQE